MQPDDPRSSKRDSRRLIKTRYPGIYKRVAVSDGGEVVQGYAVIFRHAGRQRREYAKTLDGARKLQSERRSAIANHEHVEESAVKLHDYLREWIETYRGKSASRGFRENTRDEYRRLLDSYALQFFAPTLRLREVTPRHMSQFVGWLGDPAKHGGKRLSASTIGNALNPVRAALATAQREGLIRHNPAIGMVVGASDHDHDPDIVDERAKALEREQLRMLLTIAPERYMLLLEVLAATGLRISEAIALQRRHVVTEPEGVQRNGGYVTLPPRVLVRRAIVKGRVGKPKSKYGSRDVTIAANLAGKLSDHLAQLSDKTDDALVFPSERATPLDPDNLRARVLKPLCAEVGAPWAGWHTLRHTFASLQLAHGTNIKQLQRALGHHSAAFTLDVYAHLLSGGEAPALDVWDETFIARSLARV